MLAYDVKVGPEIICIDGTDGTGKTTMSQAVCDILTTKFGKKVKVISPPFYETLPGKMVWEFLHKGWGDIKDRKVLSSFYSNDRNWWLRDHFQELMFSGYDYVITNRWALSNLIHNTTLRVPEGSSGSKIPNMKFLAHDTMTNTPNAVPSSHWGRLYHINIPANLAPYLPQEFILKCASQIFTLGEIYDLCNTYQDFSVTNFGEKDTTPNHTYEYWRVLRLTADYIRAMIIREHANFIYELEIMPWWVQMPDGLYMPFANINSVVLNSGDYEINRANLKKRYAGDSAKMDINEASKSYQEAVIENVSWLYQHQDFATEIGMLSDVLTAIHYPNVGTPYLIDPIDMMPIEPIKYPAQAFWFEEVPTWCIEKSEDGDKVVQRSKIAVLEDVWQCLGLHERYDYYSPSDYVFPEETN